MTQKTSALPVPVTPSDDVEKALDKLARRHRAAGGLGIELLNLVGGQAENLLERLPDVAKDNLESATHKALTTALGLAGKSRSKLSGTPWLTRAVSTAMGAAGGAGGLPTALAELPVTTTVLLRIIQDVAEEHGFDPTTPEMEAECLKVFASAGPLDIDNGSDLSFLTARVTLTGASVQSVLARIAPRLATVLGQKLAAQTIPVLGAVAGAATNYTYSGYYRAMADVHFGLLALARDSGQPESDLTWSLKLRLSGKPLQKG